MRYSNLLPPTWKKQVEDWLREDLPSLDIGGFVVGEEETQARLLGKSSGVLAGVPFFSEVFALLDCQVEWLVEEGDTFSPGTTLALVSGPVRNVLMGERLALNILARASGVATQAREILALIHEYGYNGRVAGTRKTTPGFRLVEKYSLVVGGLDTHRMDLSSLVMLKDNHIDSMGSITNAVEKSRTVASVWVKVEVECRSLEDAEEALEAGADIVMLDNFSPDRLKEVAAVLKRNYPSSIIEASGGITTADLWEYFSPDVDVISLGSLTTAYPLIDCSLKVI